MKKLIDKIKDDFQKSRKSKNKERSLLLSVVLGEIDRAPSKNLTNDDIVKIIKKIQSDALLTGKDKEAKMLAKYLPQMLTKEELTNAINIIIRNNDLKGMKGMGVIMNELKKLFPNRYDGKLVSEIAKKELL